ncbi:MAG TPA: hypothetical protein P5268_02795 [Candidatus Marinimicrobia bacterium]|nr:hypothetical protein [Candidatus Neomarinimicrobiota bacterium]HRS52258.1 hypothetical protein [Candidatus Neomarinimicrobiota bacterium]HRU91946.1 hypothetical protein [Candidatus Neomarinimicrobiota bacterium]
MQSRFIKSFVILLTLTIIAQAEVGFHLIGTMTGLNDHDSYMEVQGIGDINDDGYKDFAIGASGDLVAGCYVDIYLGGEIIDTIPDYHITVENSCGFGNSITSGDFNNDGISDLVVADYCNSEYEYVAGSVYLFWGGKDFDTTPDLIIDCKGYRYFFGWKVVNGGDVNGDGVDDLVVGAPAEHTTRGFVVIYYGGQNIDAEDDVALIGGIADFIGKAICGIGDINSDGYDDMLIGTDYQSTYETYGKTYLMYGGDSIGTNFETIYEFDTTTTDFGRYVGNLGDITGDTINEYAVLSPEYIRIFSDRNIEELLPFGFIRYNRAICCISNPVDINNDSVNDIIIGLSGSGALIYFGGNEIDTVADYLIQSPSNYFLGHSIASIGDINNDGQQELLIGGPGLNGRGKVCLYTFGEWQDITSEPKTTIEDFKLYQNYPNPFNAHTQIKYYLPFDAYISLSIHNVVG